MGSVEQEMVEFIRAQHQVGILSVTAEQVLSGLASAVEPEARLRPAYKYGLDRLLRRGVINAIETADGVQHYYIGDSPSQELRESLKR